MTAALLKEPNGCKEKNYFADFYLQSEIVLEILGYQEFVYPGSLYLKKAYIEIRFTRCG